MSKKLTKLMEDAKNQAVNMSNNRIKCLKGVLLKLLACEIWDSLSDSNPSDKYYSVECYSQIKEYSSWEFKMACESIGAKCFDNYVEFTLYQKSRKTDIQKMYLALKKHYIKSQNKQKALRSKEERVRNFQNAPARQAGKRMAHKLFFEIFNCILKGKCFCQKTANDQIFVQIAIEDIPSYDFSRVPSLVASYAHRYLELNFHKNAMMVYGFTYASSSIVFYISDRSIEKQD